MFNVEASSNPVKLNKSLQNIKKYLEKNRCSPEQQNKLEGTQGYNGAKSTNKLVKLLMMIHGYCCQFNLLSNDYMTILAAIKYLFFFRRQSNQIRTTMKTSW
jgi:hypothetical protein